MTTHRVVMVTDHFPPDAGNRARRMYERARYLARRDYRVIVIAPWRKAVRAAVEYPQASKGIHVLRVRPFAWRLLPTVDASAYRFLKLPLLRALRPVFGHLRFVLPALVTVRRLGRAQDSVLYTMNNPVTLHLIGTLAGHRFRSWIAELRDPIRTWETARFSVWRPLVAIHERVLMRRASLILYRAGLPVDPQVLQERYPGARLRQLPDYGVDYAPFEATAPEPHHHKPALLGIYAGGYYAEIEPEPLFRAAAHFARTRGPLRLELFGEMPTSALGDYPQVTYRGKVPYWALPAEYARADFLVMFTRATHRDTATFYPSKYAELVAAGKPIILIANRRTALSREIVSNDLGAAATNDWHSIVAALDELSAMISRSSYNADYRIRNRARFSNEASERAFVDALREITEVRD